MEYKKDGLAMFKGMEETFKEQVFSLVGNINTENAVNVQAEDNSPKQTLITSHDESKELSSIKNIKAEINIGRNDPCPCGAINPATGEVFKYKKCGLINAPQHRKSLVN